MMNSDKNVYYVEVVTTKILIGDACIRSIQIAHIDRRCIDIKNQTLRNLF
jgi:hypothetical protein